jgi:hypothetical protein
MNEIRLAATRAGARLLRNNCGTLRTDAGHYVTYGLGNPGGSDLIGWTPRIINGQRVAIFTAVEVKTPRGVITDEQTQFIETVREAGGIADAVTSIEELLKLIGG